MRSQTEIQAERRQEKLDEMQAHVRAGRLIIRQMTDAERKLNPARTEQPLRKRAARREPHA
jgi:hypothetical protein